MKEEQVNKTIARLYHLYEQGQLPWELFETKKRELLAQLGESSRLELGQDPASSMTSPLRTRDSKQTQRISPAAIQQMLQEQANHAKGTDPNPNPDPSEVFVPSPEDLAEVRQLREGDLVRGRYRLEKLLGSGGMGQVFLAQDIRFEGRYALKVLHPWVVTHEPTINRFVQEFKIMERLNHPGIVRTFLLDEDTAHDSLFFLMEYVKGETLQNVLDRALMERGAPPFTGQETLQFLRKLTDILRYTHSKRILHRDLKPTNIMLTTSQRNKTALKLLDFGLAKHLTGSGDEALHTGQAGTFFYIAPEQLMGGETATNAADIFSMGVISYQMLTGSLPVAMATPPSELNPELPQAIDGVLRKAMDVHWQQRYQTVDEYLQAFQHVLEKKPTSVHVKQRPPSRSWLSTSSKELSASSSFQELSDASIVSRHSGRGQEGLFSSSTFSQPSYPTPSPTTPTSSVSPSISAKKALSAHKRAITQLALSRDGRLLVSASMDNTIKFWDTSSWQPLHMIEVPPHGLLDFAWSPSGERLAFLTEVGSVEVWNFRERTQQNLFAVNRAPSLVWSAQENYLFICGNQHTIEFWNLTHNRCEQKIQEHHTPIASMYHKGTQQFLATADVTGHIRVWDAYTARPLMQFSQPGAFLSSLAISHQQSYLVAGTQQGDLLLWDLRSRELIHTWKGHAQAVNTLCFHPQDQWLASGSEDQSIVLWSLKNQTKLCQFTDPQNAVFCLQVASTGEWLASAGKDNMLKIWDTSAWNTRR